MLKGTLVGTWLSLWWTNNFIYSNKLIEGPTFLYIHIYYNSMFFLNLLFSYENYLEHKDNTLWRRTWSEWCTKLMVWNGQHTNLYLYLFVFLHQLWRFSLWILFLRLHHKKKKKKNPLEIEFIPRFCTK